MGYACLNWELYCLFCNSPGWASCQNWISDALSKLEPGNPSAISLCSMFYSVKSTCRISSSVISKHFAISSWLKPTAGKRWIAFIFARCFPRKNSGDSSCDVQTFSQPMTWLWAIWEPVMTPLLTLLIIDLPISTHRKFNLLTSSPKASENNSHSS